MTTKISDVGAARAFVLAGKAILTLRSERTGERYTYKVRKPKDGDAWWVSHLTDPDNSESYTYLGMIGANLEFVLTRKSKAREDSTHYRAFQYMWQRVRRNELPAELEIWHEGRCGKCGRLLTVPESIERGIGPECAKISSKSRELA